MTANQITVAVLVVAALFGGLWGVSWILKASAPYRRSPAPVVTPPPVVQPPSEPKPEPITPKPEWVRVPVDCTECSGTGKVTRTAEWYRELGLPVVRPELIGTFPCPICGGSGKLEEYKLKPIPAPLVPERAPDAVQPAEVQRFAPPASYKPQRFGRDWWLESDKSPTGWLWHNGEAWEPRPPNVTSSARKRAVPQRWRPFR